jgi:hypothetical protein
MHAFPYVWLLWPQPCLSWTRGNLPMTLVCSCRLAVVFGFCFLLQAFQPRFLRLVTVGFDSGWSYGWIILALVWCVPRGVYISINSGSLREVIHMSTWVLVALYSKVFLCAYHSWQSSTTSLSNNVPLRVYAHTTGWPDWIDSHTLVGAGHNTATFFFLK